jgi:hypothetical protein
MTAQQRFAGAADMLTGARSKDGGSGLPPDAMIERFAGDVTEGCSAGAAATMTVADAAVGVYVVGRRQYGP